CTLLGAANQSHICRIMGLNFSPTDPCSYGRRTRNLQGIPAWDPGIVILMVRPGRCALIPCQRRNFNEEIQCLAISKRGHRPKYHRPQLAAKLLTFGGNCFYSFSLWSQSITWIEALYLWHFP